jgi:predicted branched-subunit amino acid permease
VQRRPEKPAEPTTAKLENTTAQTQFHWAFKGVQVAARLPIFVMAFTFLGVGGLAREAGVPLGVALLSTLTIWAGPAQVIYFGALINGVALPAIALSISLSSVRLLPMCVSLLPLLRQPATSRVAIVYLAHNVAVTAWAESIRAIRDIPHNRRIAWFIGLTHSLVIAASISTYVGYTLAGALPHAFAAGLLFITPIYFIAALARNARESIDWIAMSSGLVLAPLLKGVVGAGLDLLVIGLVGGTLAWGWQKRLRLRAARGASL